MSKKSVDHISPWFIAAEQLGEYIGIRFGHVSTSAAEPEWIFLRHTDFDGIGGLAEILRQRGGELPRLPQIKHPASRSWVSLVRMSPKYFKPKQRVKWGPLDRGGAINSGSQPPVAVAWHVFDETATTQVRRVCRKMGITVNSFLLKHLTKAIRPYLEDQSSMIPWMIPINMRGKVTRDRDTANFSSYVGINVQSYETVYDIHRKIYSALGKGEHWANWYAYYSGRFITAGMRRFLIAKELAMSQWNLGGFSNLGDWDAEKKITQTKCTGAWLFCPPVLRCQQIGAGCVTFQNRMSLTIQTHADLTTNPAVPKAWVQGWVKRSEIDLSSVLV